MNEWCCPCKIAVVALAIVWVAGLVPRVASAGDRELEILLVNMSSNPSEAGRRCMRDIEARVREDVAHVSRMGESPLRRLVQHEGSSEFLDWPYESFTPVIERGETWLDSVVLIDCRPEARRVDVLVTSPARGVTRISLRHTTLDRRRIRWLTETFLVQSWNGFSP